MNRKTILFFAVILLTPLFLMCIQESPKPEVPEKTPTPATAEKITPAPSQTKPADEAGKNREVVCENCHMNPTRQYVPQADSIQGHLDGSRFCVYCHTRGEDEVSEVGELHHSKYSDCRKCHTDFDLEKMDCRSCHGYPDPFAPSNGNLLTIHMERGVECKSCHGDDFFRIHIQGKKFPERFRIG